MNRRAISRNETLVLALVVLFVLILGLVGFRQLRNVLFKEFCGRNLEGLGTALHVYANDYEGRLPQLPGNGPWSKKLGFAYDLAKPDFKEDGAQSNVGRTITASWYLLVRMADVSPKSFFFLKEDNKDITVFDGSNPKKLDLTELWDFGPEPHKHVNYAMHNPYGTFPAVSHRPTTFAVAAEMSPWFRLGDIIQPDTKNKNWRINITLLPPYFSDQSITQKTIQQSNSLSHKREGQHVLFGDGHIQFSTTPDVGVNHDNIYTYWSTPNNPTESDIRIGANPTSRSKENDAQSPDDSFLAI